MLDWLAERFNDIVDFFYRIFLSIVDFLKDFFWWLLDNVIQICMLMLDGLGTLFSGLNPLQYISAIPSEVRYFMVVSGFNEAMGIIVVAIIIRFTLQLIPFVRWGS